MKVAHYDLSGTLLFWKKYYLLTLSVELKAQFRRWTQHSAALVMRGGQSAGRCRPIRGARWCSLEAESTEGLLQKHSCFLCMTSAICCSWSLIISLSKPTWNLATWINIQQIDWNEIKITSPFWTLCHPNREQSLIFTSHAKKLSNKKRCNSSAGAKCGLRETPRYMMVSCAKLRGNGSSSSDSRYGSGSDCLIGSHQDYNTARQPW